jgi:hypothetical protein
MLSGLFLGSALAEDPVQFVDENLRTGVEEELWISDPTPTDMLGLTYLNVDSQGIGSLSGLEHALNLETLIIRWNHITDLSPLSGLTNLQELDAHNNGFSDLSPLAGLVNLRRLVLRINDISSISSLSGMVQLEELHLEWNSVSDISALSGLTLLQYVNLRNNHVVDVSPLVGLSSLTYVDLTGNPLSDESIAIYIPQIKALNPRVSLQYDETVARHTLELSSSPGGSVTSPGTGRFIYESGVPVRIEAKAGPRFRFAGWSGSWSSPDNPTVVTMDKSYRIRANFVSLLDTIHVDDDGPGDPLPCDSTGSDPAEDGTTEHPFDAIQEAIEIADEGATILVDAGTYPESIDFLGKSIEIRGGAAEDPSEMTWPVLQGVPGKPVVSFTGGHDAEGLLRGFVVTAGRSQLAGGINCSQSRPTIANCLIVGNRASDPNGAAVYCTDSNAVLVNCTIADNASGTQGAALAAMNSHVTVVNSILWANTPRQIVAGGTGEVFADHSLIAGGSAGLGNIDADPLFAAAGCWVNAGDPTLTAAPDDPDALWITGDYHLRSQAGRWDADTGSWMADAATSPAIDAGDPGYPVNAEPLPNGAIINLGAYGGTIHASRSP